MPVLQKPILYRHRQLAAFAPSQSLYYHPAFGVFRFANDRGIFKRDIHVFLHGTDMLGNGYKNYSERKISGFAKVTPVVCFDKTDALIIGLECVVGALSCLQGSIVPQLQAIASILSQRD